MGGHDFAKEIRNFMLDSIQHVLSLENTALQLLFARARQNLSEIIQALQGARSHAVNLLSRLFDGDHRRELHRVQFRQMRLLHNHAVGDQMTHQQGEEPQERKE